MIVYDFEEDDMPRLIWEMSNRVKDLEDKVAYLEAMIDEQDEDYESGLDGMAE